MNKLIPLIAFSVFLLVSVGSLNAFAVSVPVANHSFEDPVLPDGVSQSPPFNGWGALGGVAILNPTALPDGLSSSPPVPDGENILSVFARPGNILFQSIGPIEPNKKYTLTVNHFGETLGNSGPGKISFRVTMIDVASTTFTPSDTAWNEVSVQWNSPSSGPFIGFPLEIALDGAGNSAGVVVRYDNVRVEVMEGNDNGNGMVVGGDIVPIDSTMVLVAGTHLVAAWMIPVVLSVLGIGLFVVSRKSE